MRKFFLLLVLISWTFFIGCTSFSSYQTAQVLDPDEARFGVGLTFTSISPEEGVETDYEDITYSIPEFLFRIGVSESFDFGGKVYASFPFMGVVLDGKYQFVDGDILDMAIDLGVSYTGVEVGDVKTNYLDFYPALLMTLNFSEKFSVTLAPKVLLRQVSSDIEDDYTETIPGATLTLSIGKKVRVMPEIGFYKGEDRTGQEIEFMHYGLGILF